MVEVLLVGGRSGVGKSCVAHELSRMLQHAGVAHCLIDGDNLDAAYPKPADDPHGTAMTETNLQKLWATYAALGHSRLIYVNTVSVLEMPMVMRATGASLTMPALLTASDAEIAARLRSRERGGSLAAHVERSTAAGIRLDAEAPPDTLRVTTTDRTPRQIAGEVIAMTGWLAENCGPPERLRT